MRRLGLIALVALLAGSALGKGKGADALLVEGGKLYSLGRCEAALEPLRAALEKKPDLAQAHRLLGECLAMLDRCEEAMTHLEQALEAAPRHSDNARTMAVLVGCENALREGARQRRAGSAAGPGRAGGAADDDSADWHGEGESADWHGEGEPRSDAGRTRPGGETGVIGVEPGDVSADLVEDQGMEAPERDQLHWYGAGAIGLGLGLVLVASIVVEDYSGWKRDVANDRCVKPDGSLKDGGCPDNGWAYGLWGAGGLFVIAGGVLMLLHDWSGADEPAPRTAGALTGVGLGAGRCGAFLNLSGRF